MYVSYCTSGATGRQAGGEPRPPPANPRHASQATTPLAVGDEHHAPTSAEIKSGATLLGSLTIPGRPEHVAEARRFTARTLGNSCGCADIAVLLTSELVTNSVQHSDSSRGGGTITVTLIAIPGGIRAEVTDAGGATVPALSPGQTERPELAESGRGLQLVDMLSVRWSCSRDEAGAVTWFELADPALYRRGSCADPDRGP